MAWTIDVDRITWDEIDGETLIIDTESGYYFSLDSVGSVVGVAGEDRGPEREG